MKPFYMIYTEVNNGKLARIDDLDEALRQAKVKVGADRSSGDVYILEAIRLVRQPVPDVEVIDLEKR